MASVLLYLALSACTTAAVGAFAGSQTWESWADDRHDDSCHRSSQTDIYAPAIAVRAGSRSACHTHCHTDAEGVRKCDH